MIKKLLDSSWLYYTLAALLVLGFLVSQIRVEIPARSFGKIEDIRTLAERDDLNVVFVLIDTLRADHLSCYGYERETTPTLDRLAETGIRFDNHVAQSSWTKSSMASLWTGTYPVTNEILRYSQAIPEKATLPAELFREAGYRTAGIYRNGWLGHEFGFQQGFEKYLRPALVRTEGVVDRARPGPHQLRGSDWDATQSAIEFIDQHKNDKFFLYVHYMDVHQFAYESLSAQFGPDYMDAYDNAIHWTDRNVATLVIALEEKQLMEKTLVVIASDHGEAFREHGLEGHAKNLYQEVVATPVIIVLPWFLEEPLVIDAMTENVDLWPTILDLVGIEPVDQTDGRSLVPLLLGEADPHPGPAFAQLDRNWANTHRANPIVVVRDDDAKLIWRKNRPQPIELFDLAADPTEQINIHREETEATQELLAAARAYYEREPASWGARPDDIEIDDMKLGILRALGYVVTGD